MTYQELVTSIKKLPLEQRLSLIEVVTQSLRTDLPVKSTRTSSLERVRGMLKVEGVLPNEQELSDEYTEYLVEKYA